MGAILGRGVVKMTEGEEEEEGRFGKSLFHQEASQESQLNCLQALGSVRNMEVFLPALTTGAEVCYLVGLSLFWSWIGGLLTSVDFGKSAFSVPSSRGKEEKGTGWIEDGQEHETLSQGTQLNICMISDKSDEIYENLTRVGVG